MLLCDLEFGMDYEVIVSILFGCSVGFVIFLMVCIDVFVE